MAEMGTTLTVRMPKEGDKQTNLDRLEAIWEERSRIHTLIFHCDEVLLNEICKHCKIGRGRCRNNPNDLRSLMDTDQCVDGTMKWFEQEADNGDAK